jgi:tetratricopeptide (TPR) repeat protein
MYAMCLLGDPANPIYVKSFLSNLAKSYDNNKTGGKMAGMRTMGPKANVKKSVMQKDWMGVVTTGLEVLKINPWDSWTLIEVGKACEALELDESQIEFLRMALDGNMADPDTNRVAAKAFGRLGFFDEAIACWQRVAKAKPGDEEAMRGMSNLSVEKTIRKGGYETAESTKQVRAVKQAAADDEDVDKRLTPEQQLERTIVKKPTDMNNYIELSEIYLRDDRFESAEKVLERALQASGGDVAIRERLEDTQLRRARQQLAIAEKKAREERSEAAIKLYNELRTDLNSKEIQVYGNRVERYPANTGFKYELAVRLKKAKKYNEAIKLYQEARTDLKRRGQVFMGLGECFTHIKQYKLALTNFEAAVEAIPERDIDQRKEALYLAGKLAVHQRDMEAADKYLSALAGLDYSYKDVPEWLDKLAKLREDGPQSVDE